MIDATDATTVDDPEVDDPILELRDASVTFSMERGTSRVLNDVTFAVEREEILGVVGESGSGKSMFASALLDAVVDPGQLTGEVIYRPENGEAVNLLDLEYEELRRVRWEEISMVFQGAQSSFNPTMTVHEHFTQVLDSHEVSETEGLDHARELLSELYMDPDRVMDSYPHELSGGMKQRALIALSLVLEPNVLVMDEPTAALDLLMQQSILGLLENLQEKYDLTVVFITHDLPLVAGLADRLAVMYAFEFIETGPADELLEGAAHPYTRALLKAVPNLDAPLGEMRPIEGSAPDPVNIPQGCTYHPRCPLATEVCRTDDPYFHDVDDDHRAACFHWEEAEEAIPFSREHDYGEQVVVEGSQSAEPIVSLDDLEVHFEQGGGLLDFFGDPEIVHAVDGVDLDIYENDVVALVGESGCGKTTLGKSAIGVQRPTGGSIEYRDQDIWRARDSGEGDVTFKEIRRALQIIHQDPGSSLNPNRKVQSTLEMPLKRWQNNMSAKDRQQRVFALLEHVGMNPPEDYAKRYPHQLSGGEKQRVALIRALLMNPELILADEAVSALDVSLRVEMMDLMLELQNVFDTSFLFISHDLANARYLAGNAGGRIGVMYLGRIVEIGTVEEILRNPQHPYTQVLMWATADLETGDEEETEAPIRGIDIPDATEPPSGCRFHTRCPEAREYCTNHDPAHFETAEGHETACFLVCDDDHPFWESDPLAEGEAAEASGVR